MDLRLNGTSVLVTAASRGLGRASALELAAEGARVAVAARNAAGLAELVGEIEDAGGTAVAMVADLADAEAPQRLVDEVIATWGGLDAVVVNGPGPTSGRTLSLTDDDWASAIDSVLMPSIRLIRAAARAMVVQGGGKITLISTIGVRTVQAEMALSNSTRLALMGVVKTLALELAPDGVVLNQVAPGPIATDRMDELFAQTAERSGVDIETARNIWLNEIPMRRMGAPEDVAALVAFFSSPRCGYTTGAVIPVDGGKAGAY